MMSLVLPRALCIARINAQQRSERYGAGVLNGRGYKGQAAEPGALTGRIPRYRAALPVRPIDVRRQKQACVNS